MNDPITRFFNLYRFPWSRERFCLRKLQELLSAGTSPELLAEVEEAIAASDASRELDGLRRSNGSRNEHARGAMALDAELDRTLGALDEGLAVSVKVFGLDAARGELADSIRRRFFPDGVGQLTSLPYVMQSEEVARILQHVADDPALQAALSELGVREVFDRVVEIHARYHRSLQRRDDAPSFAEVQEARKACHERLCWIVASLLARLRAVEPGGDEAQTLWLALDAISAQNAALERYHRRRRGSLEVDPETGEELEGFEVAEPIDPGGGDVEGEVA